MRIVISPFSKPLRSNRPHAKNYPYWRKLINLLEKDGHEIIQIGVDGEEVLIPDKRFNMSFVELQELMKTCHVFIAVDNFFPHFCHYYGFKGIVIFSRSNPKIFGYAENINLLKSTKYLAPNQFDIWESIPYLPDAFIEPEVIMYEVKKFEANKPSILTV